MATIREYFETDFRESFRLEAEMWLIDKETDSKVEYEIHYLYNSSSFSKYIAVFLPANVDKSEYIFKILSKVQDEFEQAGRVRLGPGTHGQTIEIKNNHPEKIELKLRLPGQNKTVGMGNFLFTNLVYLYIERTVTEELTISLTEWAENRGLYLICRDTRYAENCDKARRPMAFISHDSRDKDTIARTIAENLQTMRCPVWYDEFSLSVGDSLKDSIEKGMKECSKCILILTPNFLNKGGWAKREYDMIFTREIVEQQDCVLPVWSNVTSQDIYKYSPILANKVAILWDKRKLGHSDEEHTTDVCRRLIRAIGLK